MKRALSILTVLTAAAMLAACGGKAASDANTAAGAMQNASNTAANAMATAASDAGDAMTGAQSPNINCGAVKPVWVNLKTKAYHEPGDQYYGKTKHGQFMCPSQAKKEGYHPAGGGNMESSGKHSKN